MKFKQNNLGNCLSKKDKSNQIKSNLTIENEKKVKIIKVPDLKSTSI
jgi:hypothetical protein